MKKYDYKFRILVLGDSCGKTKLCESFVMNNFNFSLSEYEMTVQDNIM